MFWVVCLNGNDVVNDKKKGKLDSRVLYSKVRGGMNRNDERLGHRVDVIIAVSKS
jgi:hypothetical protein